MIVTYTTEDGQGNILHQETIEVSDPEPTVEDRLAAVEQVVISPANDAKTLAEKVDELQAMLVAKGVIDRADTISIVADTAADVAVEAPGVKP